MLAFSLFSCLKDDNIDDIANVDDRQVPIYEGMTVSPISTKSLSNGIYKSSKALVKKLAHENILEKFKDVTVGSSEYYADISEDIFITIHLSNPDNFEILSFTLNGEKYSSYMFERGSNMETIIIKCNVGNESGEHKYTIDAIKYVDKSAIKDVVIRGDQTINVVVSEYVHESKCKHDNIEKIAILKGKNATCEQDGLTEGKKCELCNTVFLEQKTLPKLECNPSDWIIDRKVTTTIDGLKHTECTMCGKRINEEIIYAVRSQGLNYKVNDDGVTCTIIGIGNCTDLNIVFPEYIDGYKVTAIGENAFKGCKSITSVAISQYVSEIGARAFMNCEAMTKVILPAALKIIGEDGFHVCNSINTVYYEGNTEGWCTIDFVKGWSNPSGYGTQLYFSGELVTDLVIPDTVSKIDNHAFFGCNSLTSVTIGNGVIEIGDQAFSSCRSLSEVSLGNSVKIIDDFAFEQTPITSIVIPDSVESIGCEAFYNCKSLKTVVIGKSVSYVHAGAFLDSPNIEYTEYENGLYLGNQNNPYHLLVSVKDRSVANLKIHEETKVIINGAFINYDLLENITIPNGITRISGNLFQACLSLKTVIIPNSVTIIEGTAFDTCISLTKIVIPNGITYIGSSAFSYCVQLESINIPATVTTIGSNAFSNCTSLKEITVDENNEYYKSIDGSLYTKDGKTLIRYVSNENVTEYVIHDGVTCIGDNAFSGCKTLVEITIPTSVTDIGRSAFDGCTSLESIEIPHGVTQIKNFTFYGCTSLKNVIIPNSVVFIGERAFIDCTSLTSIIIPKSVETINFWAFRDCTSLTIYCEANYKPSGWNNSWNYSNRPVVWGYTKK